MIPIFNSLANRVNGCSEHVRHSKMGRSSLRVVIIKSNLHLQSQFLCKCHSVWSQRRFTSLLSSFSVASIGFYLRFGHCQAPVAAIHPKRENLPFLGEMMIAKMSHSDRRIKANVFVLRVSRTIEIVNGPKPYSRMSLTSKAIFFPSRNSPLRMPHVSLIITIIVLASFIAAPCIPIAYLETIRTTTLRTDTRTISHMFRTGYAIGQRVATQKKQI